VVCRYFLIFNARKREKKIKIGKGQVEKSHFLSNLTWTVYDMLITECIYLERMVSKIDLNFVIISFRSQLQASKLLHVSICDLLKSGENKYTDKI
jgi:hypothetical protein